MAPPNGTEPPDLSRETLEERFDAVLELQVLPIPRFFVEIAATNLLKEPGLVSKEQTVLHALLADTAEGYVEHAEEAVRHGKLVLHAVSILHPDQLDATRPLVTAVEKSLEKARRCKAVVDRAVKEEVVDTGVMMDLLANEIELQLFLKRYIAAMDAVHGPPRTAPKNVASLNGAPAYDITTSFLLKGLMARLRFANKSAEATPEEAAPEETHPKAKDTGGNVPDAVIKPESI